jgi:hypothetical protein
MSLNTNCGFKKLTAPGLVGTAGKAVIIYGYMIRSNINGDDQVYFYNGQNTSGTLLWDKVVQTDESVNNEFDNGYVFPSGAYVNFGSNISYVTVWYQQI